MPGIGDLGLAGQGGLPPSLSSQGHSEHKWVWRPLRLCMEVAWSPLCGTGRVCMVASWGRTRDRRRVAGTPPSTKLTRGSSGTGASAQGQETGQGKESSPGRRTGQVAGGLAGQGYLGRAALESAEQQVKQEDREGSKRLLISRQRRNKGMMMQGLAACGTGWGEQGPRIHEWQKTGQGKGLMGAGQFLLPSWVQAFRWPSSQPNVAATHQPH